MATLFIETPDATQDLKFWSSTGGTIAYDSTTPTKSGPASWKMGDAGASTFSQMRALVTSLNGRMQGYLRINDLPTADGSNMMGLYFGGGGSSIFVIKLNTSGLIILSDNAGNQFGSDGPTLSTGIWYRITLVWNIVNTTSYNVKVFVDGVQGISASDSPTLRSASPAEIVYAYTTPGANKFANWQHAYCDDSSALNDPDDIRVTAKRPNANGTTTDFTTQIGVGGSGYGSGHSPQVNEQPLSTTNGWSMIGAGSAVTEEYNIENSSTGDIDISSVTLTDYLGWLYASALVSETGSIIVNSSSSNISLTSANTMFTKIAGSTTYPAGTGADIGIITSADLTTVSLYEGGIMFAYLALSTAQTFPGIDQGMQSGGFVGQRWV